MLAILASAVLFALPVRPQTFSTCNPLTSGNCPPDPALGKSETFDFTSGPSDSFTSQGNPTFGSDGASFPVAKSGDSPQIISKFYIMFGKVEVSLKAAPGKGIVSSAVLQSDCLDEIDWEWLGADPSQVQSNYFGKGQTGSFNRGAFHADPNNQDSFKEYTIDWSADQIVWSIDGSTVRALRAQEAQGQYPQTPMQIKLGSWSGGDSANPQGTIEWAGGPTDYSGAPYTMQVKSLKVTDYSTGTQYTYSGTDGTWKSITAEGGKVNPSGSGSAAAAADAPAVTHASPAMPVPFEGTHRDVDKPKSSPGLGDWSPTSTAVATTYPGLPSGWSVTSEGKLIPGSAPTGPLQPSSLSPALGSPGPVAAAGGGNVVTKFNDQGFPTTVTELPGASNEPKQYDSKGFLITGAAAQSTKAAVAPGGEFKERSTNAAAAAFASPLNVAAAAMIGLVVSVILI
ncbi:MAG: hypothetical protein M1825_001655 [Sarcosagium campestre]|nr:MAG: hypothetical protein M1825_001655 [Sarcosagium campestre]